MSQEEWNNQRTMAQMAQDDKIWERALRIVQKYGEKSVSKHDWYGRTTHYRLDVPIEVSVEEKIHDLYACPRECCKEYSEYTTERTEHGRFVINKSQYLTGGERLYVGIERGGGANPYVPFDALLYSGNVDAYKKDPKLIKLNNSLNSPWLYVVHYQPGGYSALTKSWQSWLDGRKLRPAINRALSRKKRRGALSGIVCSEDL